MHLLCWLFKPNSDQSPSLRKPTQNWEASQRRRRQNFFLLKGHHQKFCLIDTKVFSPFFVAHKSIWEQLSFSLCGVIAHRWCLVNDNLAAFMCLHHILYLWDFDTKFLASGPLHFTNIWHSASPIFQKRKGHLLQMWQWRNGASSGSPVVKSKRVLRLNSFFHIFLSKLHQL